MGDADSRTLGSKGVREGDHRCTQETQGKQEEAEMCCGRGEEAGDTEWDRSVMSGRAVGCLLFFGWDSQALGWMGTQPGLGPGSPHNHTAPIATPTG